MGISKLITTLTADDDTGLADTSSITSAYDEYMFVCTDIGPATDNVNFTFNCSIDGGSNYNVTKTSSSFMSYMMENNAAANVTYSTGRDHAQATGYQILTSGSGNGADESSAGILHLFSPASTTYVKHFYSKFNNYYNGNELYTHHMSGYFNDTNDIDAISFVMSSGNFDGVIQIYGIS